VRVRATTTATGFAGFLSENSLGNWFAGIASGTNDWNLFENAPLPGVRMVVKSGGSVGIGSSTTPAAKLDVQGDTIVRGLFTLASSTVIPTAGSTLTPTTSYVKLNQTSSVALSATTAIADGAAVGNVLILQAINTGAFAVTIPNTANTKLVAARALSTGDTLTLLWDGSDWVELSFSNN